MTYVLLILMLVVIYSHRMLEPVELSVCSVSLSFYLLVTAVNTGKTTDLIELQFGGGGLSRRKELHIRWGSRCQMC